jgi:hypothetical protein
MRVRVNGVWFDSEVTPICIQLADAEKEHIANMTGEKGRYASFPDGWGDVKKMQDWMAEEVPDALPQ